jgi:hypothetical protein
VQACGSSFEVKMELMKKACHGVPMDADIDEIPQPPPPVCDSVGASSKPQKCISRPNGRMHRAALRGCRQRALRRS